MGLSSIEGNASLLGLTCPGHYLIEQNRSEELPALIRRLRKIGTEQGISDARVQAAVVELKGHRAWRAGDLKQAAELWGRANYARLWGAIWRGDLYRELGRLTKAEGWYLAAWQHPVAHERLGQLYEEMGEPKKARAAYERFIEAWTDADPALQNRVEKAHERLDAVRERAPTE